MQHSMVEGIAVKDEWLLHSIMMIEGSAMVCCEGKQGHG